MYLFERAPMRLAGVLVLLSTSAFTHSVDAPAEADLCHGYVVTISGTPGDDVIVGTPEADVIAARAGNDRISGRGGADVICGGAGRDVIDGGAGKDRIYGGGGDDDLGGQTAADRVYGGTGDDTLHGGAGNDRLFGKSGHDTAGGGRWSDVCRAEAEKNCELERRSGYVPDDWMHLLGEHFDDIGQTENAITIVGCESGGEPFAYNPQGNQPRGLFQFIPQTWTWASEGAGWAGETPYNPIAATASARYLYDWSEDRGDRGWDPWTNCRCLIIEYDCDYKASE